jgi:hypothetical protein
VSRYSPGVLPSYGKPFTQALADAFDDFEQTRRRRLDDAGKATERAAAKERGDLEYYERGGRRGAVPDDDHGVTLNLPDVANAFRAGPPASLPGVGTGNALTAPPPPAEPFALDPQMVASSLRTGAGRTPSTSDPGNAPARSGAANEMLGMHAATHPGAFDPTTRTFGGLGLDRATGTPAPDFLSGAPATDSGSTVARSVQLPPIGRYTRIDNSHYIDELATPRAEQERSRLEQAHQQGEDRAFQLRLAAELRGEPLVKVDGPDGPTYVPRSQAAGKTAAPVVGELKQVVGPDGTVTWARADQALGQDAPRTDPLVRVQRPDGSIAYLPRSQASGAAAPAARPAAKQWGRFMTPAGPRVLEMADGAAKGFPPLVSAGGADGGGGGGFGAGGIPGAGRTISRRSRTMPARTTISRHTRLRFWRGRQRSMASTSSSHG